MAENRPRTLITEQRELDAAALKALAHPLRVQIFDALSIYGSATASGLAERLGESSGATSYHLRQLERHGLVREVEGKGTSRERWWERPPGAVHIGSTAADESPAGRAAATMIFRELRYSEDRMLNDYVEHGDDELTGEWRDTGAVTTMNSHLTPEQLQKYIDEVMLVTEKYLKKYRGQRVAGSRTVHVVFNAFPVVDAPVLTEEEASSPADEPDAAVEK